MGQPLKKKDIKRRSIADIKKDMGFATSGNTGTVVTASNADKPLDLIVMPKAYQEAIKLP